MMDTDHICVHVAMRVPNVVVFMIFRDVLVCLHSGVKHIMLRTSEDTGGGGQVRIFDTKVYKTVCMHNREPKHNA